MSATWISIFRCMFGHVIWTLFINTFKCIAGAVLVYEGIFGHGENDLTINAAVTCYSIRDKASLLQCLLSYYDVCNNAIGVQCAPGWYRCPHCSYLQVISQLFLIMLKCNFDQLSRFFKAMSGR